MQVTVEIPDQFLHQLVPDGSDPSRTLFEHAVAAAYRERRLTMEQVRQLLGLGTRFEVDAFLQQHAIYDYSVEDLESDMEASMRLFTIGSAGVMKVVSDTSPLQGRRISNSE